MLLIIVMPLLGIAVYWIVRGDRMTERLRDLDPGTKASRRSPDTPDSPTDAACRDAPLVATCRREGPSSV